MAIQRAIFYAKPTKAHATLCEWETATIVLLVAAEHRDKGLAKALRYLITKQWQPIRLLVHTPIREDMAQQAGEEIWCAYREAKSTGISLRIFNDTFSPGQKKQGLMSPYLGEEFVDQIVKASGGRRLHKQEIGRHKRNADYRLDDWIFELKELQEEGFEKVQRQAKLAAFYSATTWGHDVVIDPEQLTESELRTYLDIVGGPIKTHVKTASDQLRDTIGRLGTHNLQGGLIFMNTGYGSLPPHLFERLVGRYATKDSKRIACCVCISAWVITNGFDWQVQFKFHPLESQEPVIQLLQKSFYKVVDEVMTIWARFAFQSSRKSVPPLRPIAFEVAGRNFSWLPPEM